MSSQIAQVETAVVMPPFHLGPSPEPAGESVIERGPDPESSTNPFVGPPWDPPSAAHMLGLGYRTGAVVDVYA